MSQTADQAAENLQRRYRKSDDLVTREIAGETLLVPIRNTLASLQQIFALNPVASFVWGQLDGTRSLGAIHQDIVARFSTTPEEARSDLLEFVDALAAAELIIEAEQADPDPSDGGP